MDKFQFLKSVQPFNQLPDDVLFGLVDLLEVVSYKKDTLIYKQSISKIRTVDLILEGGYNTFFNDLNFNQKLPEFYGPGTSYGAMSILLNRKKSIKTVIALKGTIVYTLPRRDLKSLCLAYDDFFHFFTARYGERMLDDSYAHFVRSNTEIGENYIVADQMFSNKVELLETREIVSVPTSTPIFLAARKMAAGKVSCLFITDLTTSKIIGYVTDITLRDDVISRNIDVSLPILTVMAAPVRSIKSDSFVYEALLLMFQSKSRYVLIEKEGEYVGFLSRNKLLSDIAQTPFMFIQAVKMAQSTLELKRRWNALPEIVYQLLNRGVRADIVNQVITTVADTITLKIIDDVLAIKGPAPANFVFMVVGSEGRQEQTLLTDQDNAIIYEDKANEHRDLVREYFLDFAEQVSDKLNYVGLSFCTGGFMAKNPMWTHSLSHWKRTYRSWMDDSNPETVMKFSTFFDCRFVYGDESIMEQLKSFMNDELQGPLDLFLYRMANNALQYEPPLTLFGNIKTFTKDDQKVFDLKKTMTPIVDLVRVFSLKNLIFKTNTGVRMKILLEHDVFTEKEYHELSQAYYYLMALRLKMQAKQLIEERLQPTNYIDPEFLTQVERVTLKAIFKVISQFQVKIKVLFTQTL